MKTLGIPTLTTAFMMLCIGTTFASRDGPVSPREPATVAALQGLQSASAERDSGPIPLVWIQIDARVLENLPTEPHEGDSNYDGGAFSIRLSEGYASSFRSSGGAATGQQSYDAEAANFTGEGTPFATRFIIRFYNVPDGVRLAAAPTIYGTKTEGHTLVLVRVPNDDIQGVRDASSIPSGEIKITGGFGFAVYEVLDSNPQELENVVVPIYLAYRVGAPIQTNLAAAGSAEELVVFVATNARGRDSPWQQTVPEITIALLGQRFRSDRPW